MEILKELKNSNISQNLLKNINSKFNLEVSIMEVCGTHTNVILKSGLKDVLNNNIKLINGPGCPVCVTPQGYIDTAIDLAKRKDVIITTFGDLIRVPGSKSNLAKEKAEGRDIRVVYSPLDSIKIAEENSEKEIVFLSIGFETTAPIIALSIKIAKEKGIKNYSVLNSLKTMPEAMESLVLNPDVKIDGFLCPGNVATIIGEKPFADIANKYKIPMVISGFEVNDILASIYMLIEMKEKKLRIEDALSATRAAVEEGIVAGGGTAYVNIIPKVEKVMEDLKDDEKLGAKIVLKALEEPVKQIAVNAGLEPAVILEKVKQSPVGTGFNAKDEVYVDMKKAGIVDPTKVSRSALQNAASVASMVLTTESIVTDKKEPKECNCSHDDAAASMGGMY